MAWLVPGLSLFGLLALPAFNPHVSVGASLLVALGACAWWLCPIGLIAALIYTRRAWTLGVTATKTEIIQTSLLAIMSCALAATVLMQG